MNAWLRYDRTRLARIGVVTFAALLAAGGHRAALADGKEYSVQRHDLRVAVDTRWAGCRHGGYYPIRIKVTNTGVPRNLTFAFKAQERRLPTVERTIGMEQNATVQLTLSIPMAGLGNYGRLAVLEGGRPLPGLEWDLSLPDVNWSEAIRPSILVISPNNVDVSALESSAQLKFTAGSASVYGRYGGASVSNDHEVIAPLMLPDSWIDYSGLDYVFVSLDVFAGLPSGPRTAMLNWAESGGTLVITKVGVPADKSEPLKKVLGLEGRAAAFRNWKTADLDAKSKLGPAPALAVPSEGDPLAPEMEVEEKSEEEMTPESNPKFDWRFTWPESGEAFQTLPLMQGTVMAFPKDPFPGSGRDWMWFWAAAPADSSNWVARNGFSSRRGHSEFLQFEIPGLRGVPIPAFLVLITLFALAIGPVNYFVLWKRRRLWMLVVTIPAIAFLTSATLFGYSTIAHGFSVKSRTRSVTVLDQVSRDAVTTARTSLFAGLSPSRGLKYSPETAVFPIWSGAPEEIGAVDWTETQSFDPAWIRSRTRTQFVTVNHRTERGRLVVGTSDGTKLPVENGFAWGLETLVVADAEGKLYVGGPLPAGAGTTLTLVTNPEDQLATTIDVLSRHPLKFPEGAAEVSTANAYNRYRGGIYTGGWGYDSGVLQTTFAASRLERRFVEWKIPTKFKLDPKSYVAVFDENPGVEKGADPVKETAPLYVVLGFY